MEGFFEVMDFGHKLTIFVASFVVVFFLIKIYFNR